MTAVSPTGTCQMCFKTGRLEHGHVVPSFVYRWLKDTSATGFLRTGENPNLRMQDGWKRWWFCKPCEGQIGRFEKVFSERVFPLVVNEQPLPYPHGPWLSRFIASVAWRTVKMHSERPDAFEYFTPEQKTLLPLALECWRAFIHGDAETPGLHELHFVPMGTFAEYKGDRTLPPNINRYTLRAIQIHIASGPHEAFAFIKMGPAVALGFIHPPPPGRWESTRVALGEGLVGGSMGAPVAFLDYYIDRAQKTRASEQGRSARQTEKVSKDFRANPDRAATSETFRALDADVQMFGERHVFPPDPESEGE